MPFGGAKVIIELIDHDEGDDYRAAEFLNDRLLEFEFTDRDRGKDIMLLTLRNDDYALFDAPVFSKGQKLQVTWGWYGDMTPPRRMVVVSMKGGTEVVVKCHCTLSLMDREKNYRFAPDMTDSEFVTAVADEYGYRGPFLHVDPTTARHDITKPQWRTDARQLARMARRNGMQFYIDAAGLHWHKRRTELEPLHTFLYRKDLDLGDIIEEPAFEANLSRPTSKVKVLARHPFTREPVEAIGGPEDTDLVSLGNADEVGDPDDADVGRRAFRVARTDIRDGGRMTQEEAKAEADARFRYTVKGRYKMTLEVRGRGTIGAKQLFDIWGMSESYDGLYYIKECKHVISGGTWTQSLKSEKDALREVKATKRALRANRNPGTTSRRQKRVTDHVLTEWETLAVGPDGELKVVTTYVDETGVPPRLAGFNLPDISDPAYEHLKELLAADQSMSVPPDFMM